MAIINKYQEQSILEISVQGQEKPLFMTKELEAVEKCLNKMDGKEEIADNRGPKSDIIRATASHTCRGGDGGALESGHMFVF